MNEKRNLFEDIKPISRRGSRVPTEQNLPPRPVQPSFTPAAPLPKEIPYEPEEPRRTSRYGLWYLAALCVVGFLFSLSFLFEHATITVSPKTLTMAFDSTDTFTAQKDSKVPDAIVYTVMSLTGDESMKLPSTQSKDESIPAKGQVVLYNAYSSSVYKLVKGTRLATESGAIYRIDKAVAIPGYSKSGPVVTPGSASVSVTADKPGEESNLDHSDFTLPGLAGTAQYTKIYGRTATALTGGISGKIYSIQQDAANAALGTLQQKLKASLLAKAKVQIPDGYVFFEGATVFKADDTVHVPYSKTQDVPLALHGTLTAYLLKQDTLVAAIAQKAISQYDGEAVTIPKLANLTLEPTGDLYPEADTSFAFDLSGNASIVWTVDPTDVKTVFAGRKKADFQAILSGMPAIDKAELIIKPFWKQSFPSDPNRIQVIVQKPQG